ncbi:dynein regulatory complex protein 9-like isoform X1 [Anopheles arabiensis]|uniref:Dynein regulatory complex protein 9 n=1 Tax=Anopheles arabiensis TaxID=7173 RepID=A0A8W7MUJ1_ANOAR|nr:dynein regulatory complex protein 9-like isoform X1 [Anopheles arabiensis]
MADARFEESILIIRAIVAECLRKLEILSWCEKNAHLYDSTRTYSIAKLLQHRNKGLHSIVIELSENPKHLASESCSSYATTSLGSVIPRDDSASGEDRIYYDRFEYMDRCKKVHSLAKKHDVLKFQCHELNHQLHVASQIEIAKQRFVAFWESARKEQLKQSILLDVQNLRKKQTFIEGERTNALQAAGIIDQYYDWKLASIESEIENWMNRFDREKEEQDARFQKARATEKYWNELSQIHEQQVRDIGLLEVDLERWEEDAKFKVFCHRMATKLQAWWRGVMVRKGFGKFGTAGRNRGIKGKGKDKKAKKTRK